MDDVLALKNNKNRLLGIDYGDRHVGLAISDLTWFIASPYKTIDMKKSDLIETIRSICSNEHIVAILIGNPINMNGSIGPRSQKSSEFAEVLAKELGLQVILWDERWSSQAVERSMIEGNLSRAKRSERIDQLAASYILQGFLDSLVRL
jgi:putative Holliday junction resolvase